MPPTGGAGLAGGSFGGSSSFGGFSTTGGPSRLGRSALSTMSILKVWKTSWPDRSVTLRMTSTSLSARSAGTLQRTRPENEVLLRDEIEKWSVNYTADEILGKVLADRGPGVVVFGPLNSPTRTLGEAHWWERGCFRRIADPLYGEMLVSMPVWRMTRTPPRLKWPCRPRGYHNGHVYGARLGVGPGRLDELRNQGVL